jgi:Leucine-rich repeat (LRR) protein
VLEANTDAALSDHDLELVSELVSLRILQLSRCDLITTKGVAHLGTLTNLEHLGLNHCTEVQYEVVAYFGNLKKLKVLEMAHISADTSGVGLRILTRLKALRSFHVRVVSSRGVDLSDAAFGAIGFMTQLSTLRLSGSTVRADIHKCKRVLFTNLAIRRAKH